MIELYHGSLEIVRQPEIRIPNRTLDYGKGFYLTSSFEQARAWVRRKFNGEVKSGFVNRYIYDESAEKGLKIIDFPKPDEKWLDFVMANRLNRDFVHDYDIVKGPVADDRVYASFALFEAGLLNKTELISELRAYKLVNQVLLHTEKALVCINWSGAEKIEK